VAVGVDSTIIGSGPVPATQKILKRTGMKLSDFSIFEVNEAFAVVVTYWIRELKATPADMPRLTRTVAQLPSGIHWE
jgi:acetyl-CoA acetyltransferase